MEFMDSSENSKNQKTLDADDDRISKLPDALLCSILSLLPTKHAVATTVLSTRWKYLFASLPNLDFDDRLLLKPQNGNIDITRFTNFVYRVLLLRNSPHIDSFRLHCYARCGISHINAWIDAALWRNVKQLDVTVVRDHGLLPREIFTSRTLVVLKISGPFGLTVPLTVCLSNLKVLHLKFVTFTNDDSVHRAFSSCPVLEELKLTRCKLENVHNLDISVPSLKSFTLVCCGGGFQTVINAPNVEYFDLVDFMARWYLVKDLRSLVNAHLDVGLDEEQVEEDSLAYGSYISELLTEIRSVKFLHLSGDTLVAIDYSRCPLPTFPHLTRLELGANVIKSWKLLPKLLESSPNLEVLVFVEGFIDKHANKWEFNSQFPEIVPICLSQAQHLKQIEIREFGGGVDELEVIEYFLKTGQVLKKITINTPPYPRMQSDIREKLSKVPRCSKMCQIVVT